MPSGASGSAAPRQLVHHHRIVITLAGTGRMGRSQLEMGAALICLGSPATAAGGSSSSQQQVKKKGGGRKEGWGVGKEQQRGGDGEKSANIEA